MSDCDPQTKILAQAIYEIRLLLPGYLGSQHEGDPAVRRAAHLAYALHNEALSVIEGGSFDCAGALEKIGGVDRLFGEDFVSRFKEHIPRPA